MSEATQKFSFTVESLVNVPKITGTFFIRWKMYCDGKVNAKGRTTNSIVKNFKVSWNEQIKVEISKKVEKQIQIEFIACEIADNDSRPIGTATLVYDFAENNSKNSWSLLLMKSKLNASLKISACFGDIPTGLRSSTVPENNKTHDDYDSSDSSDYSCTSEEYRENAAIIEEIFKNYKPEPVKSEQ